jgi:putative membrane protein
MTYTISGFRAAISTGDFGHVWKNIAVILIFFIVFIMATLAFFIFKFKRQYIHQESEKTCVAI